MSVSLLTTYNVFTSQKQKPPSAPNLQSHCCRAAKQLKWTPGIIKKGGPPSILYILYLRPFNAKLIHFVKNKQK